MSSLPSPLKSPVPGDLEERILREPEMAAEDGPRSAHLVIESRAGIPVPADQDVVRAVAIEVADAGEVEVGVRRQPGRPAVPDAACGDLQVQQCKGSGVAQQDVGVPVAVEVADAREPEAVTRWGISSVRRSAPVSSTS